MATCIFHKFKIYHGTDETYAFAMLLPSREAAEKAINREIQSDIDADMDGSEDNTDEEKSEIFDICMKAAWEEGEKTEHHDAILHYGDFTAYYDITEADADVKDVQYAIDYNVRQIEETETVRDIAVEIQNDIDNMEGLTEGLARSYLERMIAAHDREMKGVAK